MMDKNILEFEPERALFVPDNKALMFYEAIGSFALNNLKHGGNLFLETSERYNGAVAKLLERMGFANVELQQDINEKPRMVRAVLK